MHGIDENDDKQFDGFFFHCKNHSEHFELYNTKI